MLSWMQGRQFHHMRQVAGPCLLLLALVLLLYGRTLTHDFINLDDNLYIYENPVVAQGLSWQGIRWAFAADLVFETRYADYWMPLTIISRMLDVSLYGMHPGGHHATNMLLHACNACLLFLLWFRLRGSVWPGVFIGACFAVHPLHIESVAWAAERKDVLGALFWLLTAHAYLLYVRHSCRRAYLLSLFFFVCGMLSKPLVVTLPPVLFLLDLWPLERVPRSLPRTGAAWARVRSSLVDKLPYLILACLAVALTLHAHVAAGATASLSGLGPGARLANAAAVLALHVRRLVWPTGLAVLYPWSESISPFYVLFGVCLAGGLSLGALMVLQRQPGLAVGWLWFLAVVFPTLGLVQLGPQRLADRFVYLAYPGLYLVVASAWEWLRQRWPLPERFAWYAGSLVIVLLAARSSVQLTHWRDSIALFSHTIMVTENNALAHNNLAAALQEAGRDAEAAEHYRQALVLRPAYPQALNNLGTLYLRAGESAAAVEMLGRAAALVPESFETQMNLGLAQLHHGNPGAAAEALSAAVSLRPAEAAAQDLLGVALARSGQAQAAVSAFEAALARDPGLVSARLNLARCLAESGDHRGAAAAFEAALARLQPGTGPWRQAALAALRHGAGAPEQQLAAAALAERILAEDASPGPLVLDAAAAVFAAADRFAAAAALIERALDEARAGAPGLDADVLQQRLQAYRRGETAPGGEAKTGY